MSKLARLAERPRPPTLEEITHDITRADDDDVLFSALASGLCDIEASPNSVQLEESDFSDQMTSLDRPESYNSLDQDSCQEAKLLYNKAVHLIELHKELQTAPRELQTQFDALQKLGTEVSGTIKELREKSATLKY